MNTAKVLSEDVATCARALLPLCEALDGRRIFMTGGTGFFGKWLLHSLLALRREPGVDISLTVLSRAPNSFLKANAEFDGRSGLDFVTGDVRTFDFTGLPSYDFIIHGATAASANLDREQPDEMFSVITDGTRHVLDFVRHGSVRRLLYLSSGAVYGPQPPALSHIPESYEGSPATAYGKGKRVSEALCREASSGRFECVIARPFAFVGPYLPLDLHYAVGNFIRDALKKQPVLVHGDGRPYRSYLYASDLAVWLWTLLLRGQNGAAYNVGSPEAISIADLAQLVAQLGGGHAEVVIQAAPDFTVPPSRYVPDTHLAEESLGLRVTCPLREALLRTMRFVSEPQTAQAGASA